MHYVDYLLRRIIANVTNIIIATIRVLLVINPDVSNVSIMLFCLFFMFIFSSKKYLFKIHYY